MAGVAGFILLFAIHVALISRANTITWDEPDHIYSGYMPWRGDFGLNPEHPPLGKFVATVPLLLMQLNVPSSIEGDSKQARVSESSAQSYQILQQMGTMRVADLFRVRKYSKTYNESG